jgi:hypothetical protein
VAPQLQRFGGEGAKHRDRLLWAFLGHGEEHLLEIPLGGHDREDVRAGADQPRTSSGTSSRVASTCSCAPSTRHRPARGERGLRDLDRLASTRKPSSWRSRSAMVDSCTTAPLLMIATRSHNLLHLVEQVAGQEHGLAVLLGQAGGSGSASPGCRPRRGRSPARRGSPRRDRRAGPRRRPAAGACRSNSPSPCGRRRRRGRPDRAGRRSALGAAAVGAREHLQVPAAGEEGIEIAAVDQRADAPQHGRLARDPRPNSRTSPPVGEMRPSSMRMVVLLPAPLGPRKP